MSNISTHTAAFAESQSYLKDYGEDGEKRAQSENVLSKQKANLKE